VTEFDCPGAGPCSYPICDNGGNCDVGHVLPGTPCGAGECDDLGNCAGCTADAECGTNTECATYQCLSGSCSPSFTPSGTPLVNQLPGNCQKEICDGMGATTTTPDNMDAPPDGNECTTDTCVGGAPSYPKVQTGTLCSGGKCNANGLCVACLTAADCGTPVNPCRDATCSAGVCGESFKSLFTPCGPGKECSAGGFCKAANGVLCPGASLCASGQCADGVCCEVSCQNNGCIACVQMWTGQPDGQCAGVYAGTDPKGYCTGGEVCKKMGNVWDCAPP
jgi:hypothetical protein